MEPILQYRRQSPLTHSEIARRWFAWPNIADHSPVPLIAAALAFGVWRALVRRREARPFVLTMGLFALSYLGLAISVWPNVVPLGINIRQAAASLESQIFMLWGAGFLVPILLGHIAYNYWIFRGKVGEDSGYH